MIDEHAGLKDASYDEANFWTRGMQQADVRVELMTVLPELDEEEESPCCVYEQLHHESKFGCRKRAAGGRGRKKSRRRNFEGAGPDTEFEEDDDVDYPRSFVASIYTRQGRTSAKVDSGAFSIWVDSEVYKHISDVPIESGGEACSANGSDLLVVSSGRIQFSLWGRRFDAKVRIMSNLPSGVLIGRRFLMKHAMVIDFGRLTGSFMQNVQGKPVRFSGKIMLDDCEQV
jgi:hypothetical protein